MNYYIVNAFTNQLFSGNPAGVVLLEDNLDDSMMQAIAKENNLSETAYIIPQNGVYHIRWFSPEKEVDLCGHATLASAFIIAKFVDNSAKTIHFSSKSGPLTVTVKEDAIILNFPVQDVKPIAINNDWQITLGLSIRQAYTTDDGEHLILFLNNEDDLLNFKPQANLLAPIAKHSVTLTTPTKQNDVDYLLRYFAPNYGVLEDSVTGSVQTRLAPIWSNILGRQNLIAKQMSSRQGTLEIEVEDNLVKITGQARLYAKGEIFI